MGLRRLVRNIKYLMKTELANHAEEVNANFNLMFDNIVYELPEKLHAIPKPKIKDFEETVDILAKTNASFCRFGDGEIIIMGGGSIGFQRYDDLLATRLKEILRSDKDNILIGINYHYFYADLHNLLDHVKFVYRTYIYSIRKSLISYIDYDKQYYTAGITQPYLFFKEYNFDNYYRKIQSLWNGKDITIICGDRVFNDIQYNIFDTAKSIDFNFAKTIDAFSDYQEILNKALAIDKNRVIICMLGPTAKVLTYDLAIQGYRALDMGHLAQDYDAYRKGMVRNEKTIVRFFLPD